MHGAGERLSVRVTDPRLGEEIWITDSCPPGTVSLASLPVVVLVGLTATGKSTILSALAELHISFTGLPNRRVLTDQVIVSPLQAYDGDPVRPVGRFERYPYLRRFLRTYPGGMGEILAHMAVPAAIKPPVLFESLRGANEVRAAARGLPAARFLVLQAPVEVRLHRLLRRGDPHDRQAGAGVEVHRGGAACTLAALGVPEARALIDEHLEHDLCRAVDRGELKADQLRDALRLVLEEHLLFDQEALMVTLEAVAGDRMKVLDTATLSPAQAALACAHYIQSI